MIDAPIDISSPALGPPERDVSGWFSGRTAASHTSHPS